jgi:hypothetical protein
MLVFTADGHELRAVGLDARLHVWDTKSWKKLRISSEESLLAQSPDGEAQLGVERLATDPPALRPRVKTTDRTFRFHTASEDVPHILTLSPDQRFLVCGRKTPSMFWPGHHHSMILWETASGKGRSAFEIVFGPLAISPDSRLIACAGGVWDSRTGRWSELPGHWGEINALTFSPDGRLLFSGGEDGTIVVWDMQRFPPPKIPRTFDISKDEVERAWADLASEEPERAYAAIEILATAPRQAIPFLKEKLRPMPHTDPRLISRLLADLGSDSFQVRSRAERELQTLEDVAEPALRKSLRTGNLEMRRRIESLLGRLNHPQLLRPLRAVAILEYIADAQAREVLVALSRGDPHARLTREARAAVVRSK